MRHRLIKLSNFTQAIHSQSPCFRPENEHQLETISSELATQKPLARGAGLSYSDCCLNQEKPIIDCRRLNHFISFDEATGLLVCQPGITFAELFLIHPDFIPPVIPGTLKATLGGGIANDVHGKNNSRAGTLGHHIEWLLLQIGNRFIPCSRSENQDLFSATIGGLGLTGVIKRLAITLTKASKTVQVSKQRVMTWKQLLLQMHEEHQNHDYQVAWLDLLNGTERSVLSQANHCNSTQPFTMPKSITLPKLPMRLINRLSMTQFNRIYFHSAQQTSPELVSLAQFNNPLDRINHWNRLYGKQGLVQCQTVFTHQDAKKTMHQLFNLINASGATPTLAVLKYFAQKGAGLLSFVEPGFTIAIDFIHNQHAVKAIQMINNKITSIGGKVYLGKDLFLTAQQFKIQYSNHSLFNNILSQYQCSFQSDLSHRLNIGTHP
ncbi:MAG: L-gululonolactone oxidase [Legionellales bacterium RIFCSPHIGHO2_12_FULL_42_9]|nr:MAG: L-gululonolactone oxidase [Legionellales bacterium RIFCSPHIGHO2_12_FULL_42_9]